MQQLQKQLSAVTAERDRLKTSDANSPSYSAILERATAAENARDAAAAKAMQLQSDIENLRLQGRSGNPPETAQLLEQIEILRREKAEALRKLDHGNRPVYVSPEADDRIDTMRRVMQRIAEQKPGTRQLIRFIENAYEVARGGELKDP